jgi:hypothetical protein
VAAVGFFPSPRGGRDEARDGKRVGGRVVRSATVWVDATGDTEKSLRTPLSID